MLQLTRIETVGSISDYLWLRAHGAGPEDLSECSDNYSLEAIM